MKFLYHQVTAGPDDTIRVELSGQANVLLMDSSNFSAYRAGRRHSYRGGHARTSPVLLTPPHEGTWYVVLNLGGHAGRLNSSVSVLRGD